MSITTHSSSNNEVTHYDEAIYQEYFPLLKKVFWARKVDIEKDIDIIHNWMNRSHVSEFWHMAWPKEKIQAYLEEKKQIKNFDPYISFIGDEAVGYFEIYHPHADPVGKTYDVQEGDIGLHVLIGEEKYQRRYIIRFSALIVRLVFHHHPETQRIIGEPDINNKTIQGVIKFVGFKWVADVQLPDKIGALHILRREDFELAHGSLKPSSVKTSKQG